GRAGLVREARDPPSWTAGRELVVSSSAPRVPRNWPAGARPISASAASRVIRIPAVADQRGDNGLRTVQGGHVVLWRPAVAVDDQLPRPRPRQDGRPASRTGHRRRSAL